MAISKEAKRAYDRQRYLERAEEAKARAKAWYVANIDRARERGRRYASTHQDESRERSVRWRAKQPRLASDALAAINRRQDGTFLPEHGLTLTPEWCAWSEARARCTNPSHKQWGAYGGRGIEMCALWLDNFQAFFDHVGPRPSDEHSIDRIDNYMGYEPGNVRWATASQQNRNRRSSKLTDTDIVFIRHWSSRGYSQADIAAAFHVTQSHVSRVLSHHRWMEG